MLPRRVFFYLIQPHDHDLALNLAAGLNALGVECFCDLKEWLSDQDDDARLLRYDPNISPDDCEVVVVDSALLKTQTIGVRQYPIFPNYLFYSDRSYFTVYLHDLAGPKEYWGFEQQFDLVLSIHLNRNYPRPKIVKPWSFGLSSRALQKLETVQPWCDRTPQMLNNDRTNPEIIQWHHAQIATPYGHLYSDTAYLNPDDSLRSIAAQRITPLLSQLWPMEPKCDRLDGERIGKRPISDYYHRLKTTQASTAFGGYLTADPQGWKLHGWDSGRLWESLAAGCLTIHLDLETYDAELPVMPENGTHYIGLDLDDLPGSMARLEALKPRWGEIAQAGREWAIAHYSPAAIAQRFLNHISELQQQKQPITLPCDRPQATTSEAPLIPTLSFLVCPNWQQPEALLQAQLSQLFTILAQYPEHYSYHLDVVCEPQQSEMAQLILSSVVMTLALEQEIAIAEKISLEIIPDPQHIPWQKITAYFQLPQAQPLLSPVALTVLSLEQLQAWGNEILWVILGNDYYQKQQWEAAATQLQTLVNTYPVDVEVYRKLSHCYQQLGQPHKRWRSLELGNTIHLHDPRFHFDLIFEALHEGNIDRARQQVQTAREACPQDYVFQIFAHLLVPMIYGRADEISDEKSHYIQGLQSLIQTTPLDRPEQCQTALMGISQVTNFYLAYQAFNVRDLQADYGGFVHRIVAANFPDWAQKLPQRSPRSKIRVGYVSAYFYAYSGTLWLKGWLQQHDRTQFELYGYDLGAAQDGMAQVCRSCCDRWYAFNGSWINAAQQIAQDELDILVFPEVGMDAPTMTLAALRLAPVQCVAWGHPVTTGLPTLDYFLSSELMEGDRAETHYTETLVKLPNIGVAYPNPRIPPLTKTRADYGFDDDAVLYLCCQAPFKYLPQYDWVFPAIARQVPRARFVFLRGEVLRQRLIRAFSHAGLAIETYCDFRRVLAREDYLAVNQLCDLYLDTFDWSGGNTSLEALACHLPIITCAGEFMRGRHTDSFLKMIGVTETIAANPEDYVQIAARLGTDAEERDRIKAKIIVQGDRLYDDPDCVRGLEQFYRRVTGRE
jgi:predicted O-linked N-acetylglucosamine transferase (SPINDLY family)